MGNVIRIGGREPTENREERGSRRSAKKFKLPRPEPRPSVDLDEMGIKKFDHEYRKLMRSVDADADFSSTKAAQALLRAQLAMVIQALPVVERNMHTYGNERAAYALTSISSHIRELVHDLRSFGDQSELVDRIRTEVVQELLRVLATNLVSDLLQERRNIHGRLPEKAAAFVDKRLRAMQESIAARMAEADSSAGQILARVLAIT